MKHEPKVGSAWFTPFLNDDKTGILPMDQLLDRVMAKTFPELTKEVGVNCFSNEAYPRVDIIDYADRTVIEADVHGLTKDEVSITVTGDTLTISGKKRDESSTKDGGKYYKREIKRSAFQRSFQLSEVFQTDKIEAKFENGLLFIAVPKIVQKVPEKPTPVKVEIK